MQRLKNNQSYEVDSSRNDVENVETGKNKDNFDAVWTKVLAYLSKRLKKPSFETWIRPTRLVNIEDKYAVIAVKNEFTRNFLSQSYLPKFQEAIKEVLATDLGLRLIIDPDLDLEALDITQKSFATVDTIKNPNKFDVFRDTFQGESPNTQLNDSRLNKERCFSNFVSGKSNKLSTTFARAILEGASKSYKSLFISSEPGLGKTHLLNAIGNEAKSLDPSKKVLYVNAEEFTNEFIRAIRSSKTQEFRNKYRKIDLLLFDNAHFLEGKKSCQEEFYHTFESITNSNGKVVISSGKSIQNLTKISNNVKNCLLGSLIVEIEKPDFSTRVKILRLKSREENLDMKDEHISFLAEKYQDNVRELEGALLKLSAYKHHSGNNIDNNCIDNELISRLFGAIHNSGPYQGLSIGTIAQTVADYFGISLQDIVGKKRSSNCTKPRHVAIYFSNALLEISHARIGEFFAGRKHSSIIHSIRFVQERIGSDKSLALVIDDIKSRFTGIKS